MAAHVQPRPSRHSRFSEVRELARARHLQLAATATGIATSFALLSALVVVAHH